MSLQKLQMQELESFDDLTLYYLRLYAKGKLNKSHGDAMRHLRQVKALDADDKFTPRAEAALRSFNAPENRAARQKQKAGRPKKGRAADRVREIEHTDPPSETSDGSDSPA